MNNSTTSHPRKKGRAYEKTCETCPATSFTPIADGWNSNPRPGWKKGDPKVRHVHECGDCCDKRNGLGRYAK